MSAADPDLLPKGRATKSAEPAFTCTGAWHRVRMLLRRVLKWLPRTTHDDGAGTPLGLRTVAIRVASLVLLICTTLLMATRMPVWLAPCINNLFLHVPTQCVAAMCASFCAGITLSRSASALGQEETSNADHDHSMWSHLIAIRLHAVNEAAGYESDIRKTSVAILFMFAPLAATGGVARVAVAMVALVLGTVVGVMNNLRTALLILGLSIVGGTVLGLGGYCMLGACLGSLACARFWIRWLQDKMLYRPRKYASGEGVGGELLNFGGQTYTMRKVSIVLARWFTRKTEQTVFLMHPKTEAKQLWVVCGGNAMLATDWLSFLDFVLRSSDGPAAGIAFLLMDYPGYGWNEGRPSPVAILASCRQALRKAREALGGSVVLPQVHLLGHSLGCAAVTQLAVRLSREGQSPGRLLLSAPFLNLPCMADRMIGPLLPAALRAVWPTLLDWLVPHRWDNKALVPAAAQAGWRVGIVHGALDSMVPTSMGKELHRLASAAGGPSPSFVQVPGAEHNEVLLKALPQYAKLMELHDAEAPLQVGARATIEGLQGAVDLNGQTALLQRWDSSSGRWVVLLEASATEKRVRPENLTRLNEDPGHV